jgi:hypothetical protein
MINVHINSINVNINPINVYINPHNEKEKEKEKEKENNNNNPQTPFKGDVVAVGASLEVRKVEKENPATKQENPATKQEIPAKCEDSPPEREARPEEVKPPWRESFDTYLAELRAAYAAAVSDEKYMEERQRYHPRIDIRLTIEKACKDFWATEEGWNNKKASPTDEIDWKRTFSNAITVPNNKVWKEKGTEGDEKDKLYTGNEYVIAQMKGAKPSDFEKVWEGDTLRFRKIK